MLGTVFDLFVRKTDRMKKTAKPEEQVPPSAERAADPPAALDQRLPPEERVVPTTGELSETAKDALEDEASAEANKINAQSQWTKYEGTDISRPTT